MRGSANSGWEPQSLLRLPPKSPSASQSPLSSSNGRAGTPPQLGLLPAKDTIVKRLKFILVDQDRPRAAAISEALGRHGRGVTVAESLADLGHEPAARSVILTADEGGAIPRVVERLKQFRVGAKVIAFAEDPSPHQIVKALAAGAADYLHWPCDAASIVAAAHAATAAND